MEDTAPSAEDGCVVAVAFAVAVVLAFFAEVFLGGITVMTGAMFRLLLILTRKIEKTRRVFEID